MKTLTEFFEVWPPSHHAYGISSQNSSVAQLRDFFMSKQTSYVYEKSFDTFKIDDARSIKELQSEKTDLPSVFIIKFSVINHQAQNALLKVLEEPAENTYFFLLCPSIKQLLPTLQSRLEIIEFTQDTELAHGVALPFSSQDFVNAPLAERFELIKKFTDTKAADDKLSKEQAQQILTELEQHIKKHELHKKNKDLLQAVYDGQSYLSRNGASIKMILDMVAVQFGIKNETS